MPVVADGQTTPFIESIDWEKQEAWVREHMPHILEREQKFGIHFDEEYRRGFLKKFYKYQTDKASRSEDAIEEIETAARFFGLLD